MTETQIVEEYIKTLTNKSLFELWKLYKEDAPMYYSDFCSSVDFVKFNALEELINKIISRNKV